MKKKILAWKLFSVTALLLLGACIEDLEFDHNYEVIPNVESSILYVEAPEYLINQVGGTNFYSQEFNFDAFETNFVAENILDGTIFYELENTTSKPLDITLEFLDNGGNVLDTEFFSLDPAPTPVLERQVDYGGGGRSITIIQNTSSFRVSGVNLGDNTSVSGEPDPMVIFRSSAQFRIRLQ